MGALAKNLVSNLQSNHDSDQFFHYCCQVRDCLELPNQSVQNGWLLEFRPDLFFLGLQEIEKSEFSIPFFFFQCFILLRTYDAQ
jgi:hypothetical protein